MTPIAAHKPTTTTTPEINRILKKVLFFTAQKKNRLSPVKAKVCCQLSRLFFSH